jgi:talin
VERVEEVLAALHEGSRGTQACINAANTVSGIIGDLDTTILFATSGSLNQTSPKTPQRPLDANEHRDTIVKTAKALVEDTKALVTGAASNQVSIEFVSLILVFRNNLPSPLKTRYVPLCSCPTPSAKALQL